MRLNAPLLAALVIGGAAIVACGSDDASLSELDGTAWGEALVVGYELAGTLDIVFDGDSISVTGGCNTMNGAYSIDGGVLTAGPLAMTMMACADALMYQDSWFGDLLDTGLDAMMDGEDLVLSSDDVAIRMQPVS